MVVGLGWREPLDDEGPVIELGQPDAGAGGTPGHGHPARVGLPGGVGRHRAILRAQRLVTLILTEQASATACSSTPRRGSGTASQGATTGNRASRGSLQHRVDRDVVAAGHQRREPLPEHPGGVLGRRLVGLARLVVPAPGEPLLALAPGLGPPLHVALADLRLDHGVAGHPGDREPALAHQQHAPAVRRQHPGEEPVEVRRPAVPATERESRLERRPVRRRTAQGPADRAQHRLTVRRTEVLQPPRQPPARHHHLTHVHQSPPGPR